MSFDYQQALFHVGARVADLEAAMAELGSGLGFAWARVVEREQALWTPDLGQHTVPLRFTYSGAGPQHVELLQGAPGSMWDGSDLPGVHHLGVWVDDLPAEVERLIEGGWELEAAQRSPSDGYGVMAYLRSPSRRPARTGVDEGAFPVRPLVGRRTIRVSASSGIDDDVRTPRSTTRRSANCWVVTSTHWTTGTGLRSHGTSPLTPCSPTLAVTWKAPRASCAGLRMPSSRSTAASTCSPASP